MASLFHIRPCLHAASGAKYHPLFLPRVLWSVGLRIAGRQGDSSEDLDYYDESSLTLPDNATITGDNAVRANLDLPPLGYAAVYRLGTGSSIGANKGIVIDTIPPVIVQVERWCTPRMRRMRVAYLRPWHATFRE